MNVVLAGVSIAVDEDGYLMQVQDWTPDIAHALAQQQQLTLTEAHWEVINAIRTFYSQYQRSPTTRVLLKYLAQQLGSQKSSSILVQSIGKVALIYRKNPQPNKNLSNILRYNA